MADEAPSLSEMSAERVAPGVVLPPLGEFVGVIARVGLTSFGGGISGWMMRIVVEERRWMTEGDFLTGLALCQVFPGINVVNLSIWLGYRMHGWRGALAGAVAMVVPPGIVMVGLTALVAGAGGNPVLRSGLDGVAAAAIGLGAAMGLRAARRCLAPAPLAIMLAVFVGMGVMQWPMLAVLPGLVAVSVGLAWRAA